MNTILIILSLVFGILLILNFVKKEYQATTVTISRVFIGIVFIYSGFVKAVDPLGSAYKFIDYFNAFGMEALEPIAFPLAVVLSSIEFLIGFGLLFGSYMKLNRLLVTLFMLFFTPLTLVLAISNPVTDCGCFGDALVITNWQTFWKNIIIDIPVLILILQKGDLKSPLKGKSAFLTSTVGAIAIVYLSVYCYQHLPILDFRPYKIGNNITEGMQVPEGAKQDVFKSTFMYKNLETQETVEFAEDQLEKPLAEPDKWEFVDSKTILVEEGYHPPIHDFNIVNDTDGDITEEVLNREGYTLLLVSYDLSKIDYSGLEKFEKLSKNFANTPTKTLLLTAAVEDEISKAEEKLIKQLGYDTLSQITTSTQTVYLYEFEGNVVEFTDEDLPQDLDDNYMMIGTEEMEIEQEEKTDLSFDFYICDPTTLKTIVRSNPGLVLLKKGTIVNKWHHNDFPTIEVLTKELVN